MKKILFAAFVFFFMMQAFETASASTTDTDSLRYLKLIDVRELSVTDPSGLDLHTEEGFLWTVSDEAGGGIYLINTEGDIIFSPGYSGDDLEGITYDPRDDTVWVVEERLRLLRQISMNGNIIQEISLDIGQPEPNDGPEGITLNLNNGHFFAANEQNPRVIWELNDELEIIRTQFISYPSPFDISTLSGLFYDSTRDELWIVSDESRKIVIVDPESLQPRRYHLLNIQKPEGIAADTENGRVYVVCDEENLLYTYAFTSLMEPEAHPVADEEYFFGNWSADEPEHTFPPSMVFQMSNTSDPELDTEMALPYTVPAHDYHPDDAGTVGFPYNNTRRSRINGLGEQGIGLINTGRDRDLGSVVLALDTRGTDAVYVSWLGGTLRANNRNYALRLQYRTGTEGDFLDVLQNGQPVEYMRSSQPGHTRQFVDVPLPEEAIGKEYVQLRWKFYYTGTQSGGGARDKLRLDNIRVHATTGTSSPPEELPGQTKLLPNYPNPFNSTTVIPFYLGRSDDIRLEISDLQGRKVALLARSHYEAGNHQLHFEATNLPSGIYFTRLRTASGFDEVRSMLLLK